MFRTVAIIFFLLGDLMCFSQGSETIYQGSIEMDSINDSWVRSDETFEFRLKFDHVMISDGSRDLYYPNRIEIVDKNNEDSIMDISLKDSLLATPYTLDKMFQIKDVNFDGYSDIVLVRGLTISQYHYYYVWIYNPKSNEFEYHPLLSSLMNVSFDENEELIHTWWRYGLYEFGHAYYEWYKGELVLIIEEVEELSPFEDCPIYFQKRWLASDGTMHVEKEELDPLDSKLQTDCCYIWYTDEEQPPTKEERRAFILGDK